MALRDWAERNREFVIIFIVFVVITILSVIAMNIGGPKNDIPKEKDKKIQTQDQKPSSKKNKENPAKDPSSPSTKMIGGYFTEISPQTIITQAHTPSVLAPLPPKPEEVQMPVGWFVYFSHAQPSEGQSSIVTLDTDKDGFGTVIICKVDFSAYPQFRKMKTGKKLWVAGRIKNVNLEGTGTINLEADHFRFDGNTHVALFPDKG